jgi:uncharacterized membrane protein YozB (DUF420 family)
MQRAAVGAGWRTIVFSDKNSGMTRSATLRAPLASERWMDRSFYTGMSVAVLATVFRGFARSYFFRSQYFSTPLAPIAKVHGAIFLSWTLLFLVQTVLISQRRTDLHRRLGIVGAVLAAAVVVAGSTIAIVSLRYNFAHGNPRALSFFAIPIGNMIVFPILVAAALVWRRQPETHKRLMLLATVSILDAAVARWPLAIMKNGPVAFFAVTDLLIVAGIIFDVVSRRRVHPAYLWGGLLIVGSQALRLAVWHTAGWIAVAKMFAA